MPETQIAVDTNFLMDLARPRDGALDALEIIRRRLRGARILVTSRVIKELTHKALRDPDPMTRKIAGMALSSARGWGMTAVELGELQAVT
jgi:rRNA-processing protein FCF1